ncbi:hypothetical protein C8F01DRAFT_1133785 [Mycena amicta]|nr:hypothetical protein C8F01DRAFT_1133785 [Mycena amicta]
MYISPRALGSGDGNQSSGFSASTWVCSSLRQSRKLIIRQVPVAVVVGVLLLLSIVVCSRRSLRARFTVMGNGVAVANGMPATRELTAEQLAGSINRNPAAPARPSRRPRRTPSQISTVSLPAYMKEPGEMELVVTRGPDGEDVAIPAATVPDYDEEESSEGHQPEDEPARRRQSTLDNARYTPMPESPHDSPLLAPDPRGDAPAYFEVVDESYPPPGISTTPAPEIPEPAATTQRRSGFFSMFRPAPAVSSIPTTSPSTPGTSTSNLALTHTRTRSTTGGGHSPSPSPSPLPSGSRHRSSTSTSTLFSLGRKKSSQSLSANNLTSPSLISLSSISAPLPHTLYKTEFTSLPKAGLTPEQFKLISGSKDGGLNRFGVPFGDVAVAYAQASANASRVALDEMESAGPPPGWEESAAGPSGENQPEEDDTETAAAQLEVVLTAPSRSESRASGVSMQTFATAEDGGVSDSEDLHGAIDNEPETAHTVSHTQEATDATIRP